MNPLDWLYYKITGNPTPEERAEEWRLYTEQQDREDKEMAIRLQKIEDDYTEDSVRLEVDNEVFLYSQAYNQHKELVKDRPDLDLPFFWLRDWKREIRMVHDRETARFEGDNLDKFRNDLFKEKLKEKGIEL